MRRSTVISIAIGLALVGAQFLWRYGRGPEVVAVAAQRGTAVEIVYATGAVEPVRWAKVASLIRDRIVEVCDCEGKVVTKGDILARLDDREVQAQLQELRAREDFLKHEMSRVTELISRAVATTQAFERASMDLRQVQAQISVQLEKINDYTIIAPMDGIVLRRDGEIGEIAEVGQILFRVGVPKPLQIVAEVNEEDIPRVAVGQVVLLRNEAFSDRRLEGTVREITPMGDVAAKTYRIKIALPNDTPLIPGMSVEANVITREKSEALLVPTDAVRGNQVFVIDGSRVR
jgi:RND family efflux transporter MFP subunit